MVGEVRKHGSGIYVREGIVVVQVELSLPNLTAVHLPGLELFVLSVYRPPSYGQDENQSLRDAVSEFCVGRNVVVLGDFNLPSLKWDSSLPSGGYVPPHEMDFYNMFLTAGLTQWVVEGTYCRSGNILDLALSSQDDVVGDVLVEAPLPGCHHCPVVMEYYPETYVVNDGGGTGIRLWNRGNFSAMQENFDRMDWGGLFDGVSLQEACRAFTVKVNEVTDRFVPVSDGGRGERWNK